MIRLHHCHQTRSMRILWLLNELEVEFDLVVHPFDASLRQPEFLAMSPAGRVPALEIDGQTLFESGAILEYLCEMFPDAGMGRAPGTAERADWLVWVHFAETIGQHCANLNQQHNFIYPPEARSPVVVKLEGKRAEKCLAALEEALSDGRDFLLRSGFSAADIAVGQSVYMLRHFVRVSSFTRVDAWFDRISSRPAYLRSLPQEGDSVMWERNFYSFERE